jgi:hypothetical protein
MDDVMVFAKDFVREISKDGPHLTVRCAMTRTLELFGDTLEMLPDDTVIEMQYDTSFNCGNHYVSCLSVR